MKLRKKLLLLQALAILIAVLKYGMRAAGQDEGRNSNRILSSVFHPYLAARVPLAASGVHEWMATSGRMNRACVRIHQRRTYCRHYRTFLWMVLPQMVIGTAYSYENKKARTLRFCLMDKVYLYQLNLKLVVFCILMEFGALVNEMLLMMSGDIESNPGPRSPCGKRRAPDELEDGGSPKRPRVQCTAKLKDVVSALHSVCHKWYYLGLQLDIPTHQLQIIESDKSGVEERMRTMLEYWMSIATDPLPSWIVLVDALRAPTVGENRLATELEGRYCSLEDQSSRLGDSTSLQLQAAPSASYIHKDPTPSFPPMASGASYHVNAPQMHPVKQYANYLKASYRRWKFPIKEKWPPKTSKKYINLALVKKEEVSVQQADNYTRSTLHGSIDDIVKTKVPLDLSTVGRKEDGSLAQLILVEGGPGIGKTTFSWKLCRKWSKGKILQEYGLVVLLKLRDKRVREARNIYDLFYHGDCKLREAVTKEVVAINGKSVFLLFEGYDELSGKPEMQESIFLDILSQECLPEATVMVTSRPSATDFLQENFKGNFDQHIEILGFTSEDIKAFIRSTFTDQGLSQEFSQYLNCYPHIQRLMYVPLNAVIVTEIFKNAKLDESQEVVPTTLTELYTSLTCGVLLRYLKSHKEYEFKGKLRSFSDLPKEIYEQFRTICEVAFRHIKEGVVSFDDLPHNFNTLDLMQSAPELFVDQGTVVSYNFFHLTLQEFLAAVHITEQPVQEQLYYFCQAKEPSRQLMLPNQPVDLGKLKAELLAMLQELHEPLQESPAVPNTLEPEAFICKQVIANMQQSQQTSTMPNLQQEIILHTRGVPSRVNSPSDAVMMRRRLQNVMRFTAGLMKFKGIPLSSILDLGMNNRQEITLNTIYWLFEAEYSGELIGETTILTFDYTGRSMNPSDCFVLGFGISHLKCAWKIWLLGTHIGNEGLKMLVAGMSFRKDTEKDTVSQSIQEVCLQLADCDITSAGLGHLKEMPKEVSARITKLDLSGNSCEEVTGLLMVLTNLETLKLQYTPLSSEEVSKLAKLLSHTEYLQNLKYLNLRSSLPVHSCSELSSALCNNSTLEMLNLGSNTIGLSGASALADMLRGNTTLQELDVIDTLMGEEGALKVIQSLEHNSTLECLWIDPEYVPSLLPELTLRVNPISRQECRLLQEGL